VPEYDLAVVGAGLGGLAAAAIAARQNKRTIVLEPGESVGGSLGGYGKNGFFFSPWPALSYGFERGGPLQQLSEELGIALNASVLSPCYQVVLPDRRITVYAEHSGTLEELRREFPREIDGITKFYRDMRKESLKIAKSRFSSYLASRRKAGGYVRKYRFSNEMLTFLEVQSLFFFHLPIAEISLSSLVTLCDSAPLTVHGGFMHLAEQIAGVLLKNGGEIRYHVPLAEVAFRGSRPVELSTSQGSLKARTILLNTVQQDQNPVLYCGIHDEVVPVGMSSNVLGVSDYTRPELFFALSLGAGENGTGAPKAMRTLSASSFSSPTKQEQGRLMQQVGSLIPFLDRFLVFADEYQPASRSYAPSAGLSFKPLRTRGGGLLSRSSQKDVFLLHDGVGTPAQAIAAAHEFIEKLR